MRQLTKKQAAFLDELFSNRLDDILESPELQEALDKFMYWIKNDKFRRELDSRIEALDKFSRIYAARNTFFVLAKLFKLTLSGDPETVRKAACDFIKLSVEFLTGPKQTKDYGLRTPESQIDSDLPLTDKQAQIILNDLAEFRENQRENSKLLSDKSGLSDRRRTEL